MDFADIQAKLADIAKKMPEPASSQRIRPDDVHDPHFLEMKNLSTAMTGACGLTSGLLFRSGPLRAAWSGTPRVAIG